MVLVGEILSQNKSPWLDINDGASLPLIRRTCISEGLMKRFDFPVHYHELVKLVMDLITLF